MRKLDYLKSLIMFALLGFNTLVQKKLNYLSSK